MNTRLLVGYCGAIGSQGELANRGTRLFSSVLLLIYTYAANSVWR